MNYTINIDYAQARAMSNKIKIEATNIQMQLNTMIDIMKKCCTGDLWDGDAYDGIAYTVRNLSLNMPEYDRTIRKAANVLDSIVSEYEKKDASVHLN